MQYRIAIVIILLMNKIVTKGSLPQKMVKQYHMQGQYGKAKVHDVSKRFNYRPIHLLCHSKNIFDRIIEKLLRDNASLISQQSSADTSVVVTLLMGSMRLH